MQMLRTGRVGGHMKVFSLCQHGTVHQTNTARRAGKTLGYVFLNLTGSLSSREVLRKRRSFRDRTLYSIRSPVGKLQKYFKNYMIVCRAHMRLGDDKEQCTRPI